MSQMQLEPPTTTPAARPARAPSVVALRPGGGRQRVVVEPLEDRTALGSKDAADLVRRAAVARRRSQARQAARIQALPDNRPETDPLSNCALFTGLDELTVAQLRRSMTEVRLHRGQELFREGSFGTALFVVAEGAIKIGRSFVDGRTSLLGVLGPGETFGELSLFDGGPRTATATAVTTTRLHTLSRHDLEPWLQRPEVCLALLARISGRLRHRTEASGDMVFRDAPARAAKTLLDLATRFGTPGPDGSVDVAHGLTQEELSQLVGCSRETLNKVLAEFSGRGWLRPAGRSVVLLDLVRLGARAR